MRKEVSLGLRERYSQLKEDLVNPANYPYVNKLLNLPSFIKEVGITRPRIKLCTQSYCQN